MTRSTAIPWPHATAVAAGGALVACLAIAAAPARSAGEPLPDHFQFAVGAQAAAGRPDLPIAVAAAPDGEVFVVDGRSHRVQRFDARGRFVGAWGSLGADEGQFAFPIRFDGDHSGLRRARESDAFDVRAGIAVASDGTILVTDGDNHRVQAFDRGGRLLRAWRPETGPDAPPAVPVSIASLPDGSVLLADRSCACLRRTTVEGAPLERRFGADIGRPVFDPVALAASGDGTTWVADANGAIVHLSKDWTPLGTWDHRMGLAGRPTAIAVALDGSVYVATWSWDARKVQRFDAQGVRLAEWARWPGAPDDALSKPAGLAVAPDGRVLVADTGRDGVGLFSPDGVPLELWAGDAPAVPGALLAPADVASAPDGRVYVADTAHHRVARFRADGAFAGQWGRRGAGTGEFVFAHEYFVTDFWNGSVEHHVDFGYLPYLTFATGNAALFVADIGNGRIQRFDAEGTYETSWPVPMPGGLDSIPDGDVLASLQEESAVRRFAADGAVTGAFGIGRGRTEPPAYPGPLDTTAAGTLWVGEQGRDRLSHWTIPWHRLGVAGSHGDAGGQFDGPRDLEVAADGAIFVADRFNHRVQRLGPDGTFRGAWGRFGAGEGEFRQPAGVALGADGRVLVADMLNHRVQVFGPAEPVGWRVELFGNRWLAEVPVAVRSADAVAFDWGTGAPDPAVPRDGFSLRASASLPLPAAAHRVTLRARGGARLWIDGRLAVDDWDAREVEATAANWLVGGRHRLRLEYNDPGGTASLSLVVVPVTGTQVVFLPIAEEGSPRVPLRRLAGGEGRDWQPAVSPDGATVVYVHEDDVHGDDLRLVGIDGVGDRRVPLTAALQLETPTFTPDGAAVVFGARPVAGGSWDLVRVRVDTGTLEMLTRTDDIDERRPSLSPDGTWLAFDEAFPPFKQPDVYRLDLASGARRLLGDNVYANLLPMVSPDGARVYYRSARLDSAGLADSDVFRVPADGGTATRLTASPGYDGYASEAPGGGAVVFQSDRSGRARIYEMDPTGGTVRPLTDGPDVYVTPRTTPDGRAIVLAAGVAGEDYDIYVLPLGR